MRKSLIYTDEQFIEAVKSSFSSAEVLKKLGLRVAGGNYRTVQEKIKKLEIDTSHWKNIKDRQGWARGKRFPDRYRIPLEKILVKNSPYTDNNKLKKRLFKEGILDKRCYRCQGIEWQEKPMPLEIEHKNGDKFDNRIENLTILCPNCHALTDTYRGKNKKYITESNKNIQKNREEILDMFRAQTEKIQNEEVVKNKKKIGISTEKRIIFFDKSLFEKELKIKSAKTISKELNVSENTIRKYCEENDIKIPYKHDRDKRFNPTKEELEELIWEKPTTQIAKDFGVSDKAVEKRCKKFGITKPPRGYWAKKNAEK